MVKNVNLIKGKLELHMKVHNCKLFSSMIVLNVIEAKW